MRMGEFALITVVGFAVYAAYLASADGLIWRYVFKAYRGAFRARPDLGRQPRTVVDTGLFVLPSTSPANAAVPYGERLRWFRRLARLLS